MSTDFYVFYNNKAQDALDYINNNGDFPYSGRNAATGASVPNQTTKWADEVMIRATDGAQFFQSLPQARIAELSQDQINYFLTTFEPSIEQFQSNWVASVEV